MKAYDMLHIDRCDAMEYLDRVWGEFPTSVPAGGVTKDISVTYFRNWRFINTQNNEIFFGNCYSPGISFEDFEQYKSTMRVPS